MSILFPAAATGDDDSYERLERLIEIAPSRQVGQPGNDAVDQWVADLFARAVQTHNDPTRWAEAERRLADVRQADAALWSAQMTREQMTQSALLKDSPWWIRFTVERPIPTSVVLLIFSMLFIASWRVQKRTQLRTLAIAAVAGAAFLPIIAALVVTEAESPTSTATANTDAPTTAQLEHTVVETANAALEADRAAAEALTGLWQHGRIRFNAPAFTPGDAVMTTAEPKRVDLYQLTPNLVEPANLPASGFHGRLVYAGRALPDELAGHNFTDAAAVVEFDCARRWLNTITLGARLIIVLEPPAGVDAAFTEAALKSTESPISVPRFYLTRNDFYAAFADGQSNGRVAEILADPPIVSIQQKQPSRWHRQELATDWLFIPGTEETKAPGTPFEFDPGRQLVHIQAYKDCASIVPTLSPGANSAANLILLAQLVEHFADHPPRRPVLISAVNDHTNALNGEHQYAFAAFAPTDAIFEDLEFIDQELAQQHFVQNVFSQTPNAELIERLRYETTLVGGQMLKAKEPAQDRLAHLRNLLREQRNTIEYELKRDRQRRDENDPNVLTKGELEQREHKLDEIHRETQELIRLMGLFNRFGRKTRLEELADSQKDSLKQLFRDIADEAEAQADELARDRENLIANLAMRRQLRSVVPSTLDQTPADDFETVFNRRHAPLPAIIALALDLSFDSDHAGLFPIGHLMEATQDRWALERVQRLSEHVLTVAAKYANETAQPNRLVDTIRNARGLSWQEHLGGHFALGSRPSHEYMQPGLTLTAIRDFRRRAFTPHDTVDRINRNHFATLMRFARDFVPRLIDSNDLGLTPQARGEIRSLTVRLDVRKIDRYSTAVSKSKLPGALVLAVVKSELWTNNVRMWGQVRPWPILMADQRGGVLIRGGCYRSANILAFGIDKATGHMNAALDLGGGEKQFKSTVEVTTGTKFAPMSVMTFQGRKVDLIGLTEPLTMMPVPMIDVIDAAQESTPRHYSLAGLPPASMETKIVPPAYDGTAALWVEPNASFKLRIGQGLAINSDPTRPAGKGFDADVGALTNLVIQSAKDMTHLTSSRLQLLNSKGVLDDTATDFNEAANARIAAVEHARESNDNETMLVEAERARGSAYNAYTRAKATINDLIKAVIFFLALVIPFCYFLMKLVTPFTTINKQIAMFVGIFVIMALALKMVHPAFAVAQTPTIVLLAFVILGLAVFVGVIVASRFNESMTHAVELSQKSESVDAPQSRLAGVAFLVGVNNMKRRRIRTVLTCTTIVLVTFTMLSVISVGQDVEPLRLRLSGQSPYDGWIYTRPSLAPINEIQLGRLRAHFEDRAQAVARAWVQRKGVFGEYQPYLIRLTRSDPNAAVDELTAKVLLGLEVGEDGFIAPMPLLPGGRWFSANDANEIVLSEKAAKLLDITTETISSTTVHLGGRKLQLVGLLDDEVLQSMRDVSDVPLLPLVAEASFDQGQAARSLEQERKNRIAESAGTASLAGGALLGAPGVSVAEAKDIAIIPIDLARQMGNAELRTLSFKYAPAPGDDAVGTAQRAWNDANDLIAFQYARIAVGLRAPVSLEEKGRQLDAGQYALTSRSATEIGGILKVAIPIVLGATIILNTMLGSVMERKREVAIYNAIGLNPGHVMMFFLAESIVFGLVGSVAGYLIGQALSLVISHFVNLNLNYSSLSVIVVIFLAIATVLLSTIYPAMMAARAAVPSGQRRWSLPQPEGDEIHVDFPFSYDAHRVMGVCAYLDEFMQQNTEASTGRFLAKPGPIGLVPTNDESSQRDETGIDNAYAMVYDVAPAPFDLGVNQKMEVYAYYNSHVRAHMLSVHLTRLSGQINNWVAVNQPFLESLRKRLLGWRSQRAELQQTYYQRGEQMFEGARELPVS